MCLILNTKDYLTKFDSKSYEGVFLGYFQNSKAYIILSKHTRKIEESLNVTFNETSPPSKTSPLVDDDLDEEEAIKVAKKKILESDIEDETLEINELLGILVLEETTALAISTTEAEYISTRKACQQALWMKQALIDYDVQLDDVPIMCDNKEFASIMVNGKRVYELKGKFLDDLRDNDFSGTIREYGVEHSEYFLKIFDPINLPNVNYERLRLSVFPISLVGNASKWFDEFKEFKVFNFLLKVDMELFAHDIEITKTYKDYENELNDELEEPWSEDGVPYEICDHIFEPFRFNNGKAKWPTCNSNEDEFCDEGELSGMVQVGYMTYFQDYEWYIELADRNLKEEALKQKAIYEKSWGDASQSVINFYAWLKSNFLDNEEHEDKDKYGLFDNQKRRDCKIRRFEMIKYSFGEDEEYVAIKEHEYDDLTSTNEETCRTYQEIFHRMDEEWMAKRLGEAVALSAEGIPVVVAPDAFSTRVANLFKTMIVLFVRESGVKKEDLVSFKISAKSSSFPFSGSESRPPMIDKENYVPWSSHLLRYAKSRPNGKLIYNSILNGPYARRMVPEPGDAERDVNVNETFHEQTDD
nr:retrovirus-related Pol polyprotein from transposon TNT 1-94 [Tanacetum cinerariifolium]